MKDNPDFSLAATLRQGAAHDRSAAERVEKLVEQFEAAAREHLEMAAAHRTKAAELRAKANTLEAAADQIDQPASVIEIALSGTSINERIARAQRKPLVTTLGGGEVPDEFSNLQRA